MQKLRQGTAATVTIDGVVLADGLTPADALTIVQADITLTKETVFAGAKNEASGSLLSGSKTYAVSLDATDTDTIGVLKIDLANNDTIPAVWKEFEVVPQGKYDGFHSANPSWDVAITGSITDAAAGAGSIAKVGNTTTITYTYDQTGTVRDRPTTVVTV